MTDSTSSPPFHGTPRISVVLATHNRCALLSRTLPTLIAQDLPADDFEIIIVNDGSTDGTLEYLRSVSSPCALLVIDQLNRGAAAARNAGLRRARGPLALLMDDDLLCPSWLLRRHLDAHAERPGGVVYGATGTSPQSPRTLAAALTRLSSREATARLERGAVRPGRELALDPNCSISLEMIKAIGGFDEAFCNSRETNEIALRLRSAGVAFRYIRDAAVDEVYIKSTCRLGRDDARAAGASEVRLRRMHTRFRPESVLASMADGGLWKTMMRRVAATLPGVDLVVSLPMQACEALSGFPLARSNGVRLLKLRQGINLYRGAASEAGSWRALSEEFGVTVPCLVYHHVGPLRPGTYPELTIAPLQFERHLRWIRDWGYQAITPSQWAQWRTGGGALPRWPVMFTFDDAYADTAEYAFPLLDKYGMTAAAFAVAGELGGSNRWDERLGSGRHELMGADQFRYWSKNGIEFGAHSMTHADLTRLADGEARREIESSRFHLAELLGQPVIAFAYPYGYHDAQSLSIARSCFDLAFTTTEGLNSLATCPYRLRRTMVLPDDRRGDLFSRLRLGYSLRHRWRGRLARLRPS